MDIQSREKEVAITQSLGSDSLERIENHLMD